MSDTVKKFLSQCTPCGDQIIVIPEEKEKVVKGIHLATENKGERKQQRGEIVAVGPGRQFENSEGRQIVEYRVGDIVVFKRFAGDDYLLDDALQMYPQHEELREGLTPVKVLRQDSILHSVPKA